MLVHSTSSFAIFQNHRKNRSFSVNLSVKTEKIMIAQVGYDEIASLLAEMDPTKMRAIITAL